VVNYDLPWNPQRIEQRIGRCHRYGQKFDVVVVNFLNKNNAADKRVYELLAEKVRLFSGVFGASDEVLGAVESGVDFEKRIAAIYQKCRTPEQIQFEFDQLQGDLEAEIAEGQRDAREKLLNNFDQEVVERVRIQSHDYLDRFNERLWLLTRYLLAPYARFEEQRQLTLDLVRAIAEHRPERVVCLDNGFTGNDQLKANAVQLFKNKGVTSFKTV
jgi:superfamily II DNA/RNA helicase